MASAPADHRGAAERVAALLDRVGRLARSARQADGTNPVQWEALRFLAQANRYSRSPSALAEFLGSTRGTVSQTLLALERAGLIASQPDRRDGRRAVLDLTPAGTARLAEDPWNRLAEAAAGLAPDRQAELATGLTDLLRTWQRANGLRAFGQCATCRYFRRLDARGEAGGPHRCGLTGEPLSTRDSTLICREHAPAA